MVSAHSPEIGTLSQHIVDTSSKPRRQVKHTVLAHFCASRFLFEAIIAPEPSPTRRDAKKESQRKPYAIPAISATLPTVRIEALTNPLSSWGRYDDNSLRMACIALGSSASAAIMSSLRRRVKGGSVAWFCLMFFIREWCVYPVLWIYH